VIEPTSGRCVGIFATDPKEDLGRGKRLFRRN
jgi:hypothetical protein